MAREKRKKTFDPSSLSTGLLKTLSINLGYGATGNKADILAQIKQAGDVIPRLAGLIDSLSDDARSLYLSYCDIVPSSSDKPVTASNGNLDLLKELERVGLCVQTKAKADAKKGSGSGYEFVPTPEPLPEPDEKPEPNPQLNVQKFLMDIVRLLQMVRQKAPKVLTDGSPGIRFLNKLAEVLNGITEERDTKVSQQYYNLLYWLALETHLTSLSSKELKVCEKADAFFSLPLHARIQELFEAWLRLSGMNELTFSPTLLLKGGPSPGQSDVPDSQRIRNARRSITEILSVFCKVDRWYSVSDFISYTRTRKPDILVKSIADDEADRNKIAYRGIFTQDGNDLHDGMPRACNWHRVEGDLVSSFLLVLSTIGVAAISTDRKWFTLTPAGRYCLGLSPEPEAGTTSSACLVVQPNFEVVVYRKNATPESLHMLGTFADLVSDQESLVFSTSLESIYRASEAGIKLDEIVSFLKRNSTKPIPENVTATLEEWWQRCNQVFFSPNAMLIEYFEPPKEFAVPPPEGSVVSGSFIILPETASVSGKLPEVDHKKRIRCARIASDGTVTIDWKAADAYVEPMISQFAANLARRDDKLIYKIDFDKIGNGKTDADDVIAFLNSVSDEIPPPVALKLVAIKGGVPPAKTFDLVAVTMPEIATRLKLDEKTLGEYSLGKFENRWLVYASKWNEVTKKLAALGIALEKDEEPVSAKEAAAEASSEKAKEEPPKKQTPEDMLKVITKTIDRKLYIELNYIVKNGIRKLTVAPIELMTANSVPVVEARDLETGNKILLTVENIDFISRIFRKTSRK